MKTSPERQEIGRLLSENANLRYRLMDLQRIFDRSIKIALREQRKLKKIEAIVSSTKAKAKI